MERIRIEELKINDVIFEECQYGNGTFVVVSNPVFEDDIWEVKVKEVVSGEETYFSYNIQYDAYRPVINLLTREDEKE